MQGRPIPFITVNSNSQFEVSLEAMNVLQRLNSKKLASICIVGPYRTGKSFIANRFLGRMKGFEIGATV